MRCLVLVSFAIFGLVVNASFALENHLGLNQGVYAVKRHVRSSPQYHRMRPEKLPLRKGPRRQSPCKKVPHKGRKRNSKWKI
ncbi:uncharacterized protein B0P05DRAFT_536249, partial [Gilbertella persicaria]|uniref:uncharacterized protein n=1 Tax=Gilbertella persicaria TaxID=101096 RepID=UPI00221E91BD